MDEERAERIEMIRDSASAVVPPDGDLSRVRALRFGAHDFDRAVWRDIAALGWPAILIDEAAGGAGLGMGEYCALNEMLGRGLVSEPLAAVAGLAPVLDADDLLPVLAGERIILPALAGELVLQNARLSGQCDGVLGARDADGFLVRAEGRLYVVDAAAVSVIAAAAQDGGTVSRLQLDAVPGREAGTDGLLDDRLALGIAAYLLGLGARAFEMTLDYLRARQQFGRAIGSFQALQHRCADLLVRVELARAAVFAAARAVDEMRSDEEIAKHVSRAKARAGDMAMLVTRQAIQLHGGIGFADESDIGLYLRRAMVLVNQGGSPAWHRKRYGALIAA